MGTGDLKTGDREFYADARLYDAIFPGHPPAIDFYRAAADRQGGSVLELGSGTGHKILPIAADGHPCTGLELSPAMLAEAQRKADARGLTAEFIHGDMRELDLGRSFDLIFIAANSLLHLHEAAELIQCFRSVRSHLAPDGRFMFDIFNPSVSILAAATGTRTPRPALSFVDPKRGAVSVDVAESYDAATQVTSGTWYFSTPEDPDFAILPLNIRSVFPQELPLLLQAGGLRLLERHGGFSGSPFRSESGSQVCVCARD